MRINKNKKYPQQQIKRVKRVATTRWMSHLYSLNTVLETLDALLDTLEEVRLIENDKITSAEAGGLLTYFTSLNFLYTAWTFKQIFDILSPLNIILQKKDLDILTAIDLVVLKKKDIYSLRSDKGFKAMLKTANEYSKTIDIEKFDSLQETLLKRRKRNADKLLQDDPLSAKFSPLNVFKIDTYFFVLDQAGIAINEKFQEESLGLIKDICLLSKRRLEEVRLSKKLPDNAFNSFAEIYDKFIDHIALRWEYLQFAEIYPLLEKNLQLPKNMNEHYKTIDSEEEDDEREENEEEDINDEHERNQNQNLGSI